MMEWLFLLTAAALCIHIQGVDETSKGNTLQEILDVRNLEKMLAPFDSSSQYNPDEMELMSNALVEMENKFSKLNAPLMVPGFDVFRKAESHGLVLMEILKDVYAAKNSHLYNRTMIAFVEKCKQYNTDEIILRIGKELENAIQGNDRRERIKNNYFFSILNRMATVNLFQIKFEKLISNENEEEGKAKLSKLENRMLLIRTKTDRILQDLCVPATLKPGALEIEEDCENDGLGNLNAQTGDLDFSDINDGREYVEVGMQTVLGIAGAFPLVGSIAGAISPLITFFTKSEDQNAKMMKFIQQGFHQLHFKLDEFMGRFDTEIKLQIVRTVETSADNLMQNLEEIVKESDPAHKNQTILDFLKECDSQRPFQKILDLNSQIGKAFRTQWENDKYHSKKKMNELKRRLYDILHKLVHAFIFQQHFNVIFSNQTIDARDKYIAQLDRKMIDIKSNAEAVLTELAQRNYLEDMKSIVNDIMSRPTDLSGTATLLRNYVHDIFTSDKFCIVTYRRREPFLPVVYADDVYEFMNNEYYVMIVRSRKGNAEKYNLDLNRELESLRDKCMHRWDDVRGCPFFSKDFNFIIKDVNNIKGGADEDSIVDCKMDTAAVLSDTDCKIWHGSGDRIGLGFVLPRGNCDVVAFLSNS